MSLKAKIEAIIYAAEEPITIEQISLLVKDMVLAEEVAAAEAAASEVAESSEPSSTEADTVVPKSATVADAAEPAPATAKDSASNLSAVPADEAVLDEPQSAHEDAPEATAGKKKRGTKKELSEDARVRARVRVVIEELAAEYTGNEDRGMEIRAIAGGYKMATKPEHHDVVRAFAKSLKPPVRLSLAALETLAVVAYKQPVTVPEISEIRGVEASGVIGTLLDRKLITTAGRKQVVGRPMLYKTSKDFLLRFGLNDISELPSMEEFEKLAADGQGELFTPAADAESSASSAPASEEGTSTDEQAPAAEKPAGFAETQTTPEESAATPSSEDEN